MTIGSQFLARLNEAKKPAAKTAAPAAPKGPTFDRGTEAMKRAMRDIGGENNFADKIAETMNMIGVPGMYLNKPEVRESVVEAAGRLRSRAAQAAAFLVLHSALTKFSAPLAEAKEEDLEGQGFQQLVEEILVSLGLPEEFVGASAKPAIKSGIKRTVARLKSDAQVRIAFVTFALRAKIKLNDSIVGAKKEANAMKAPVKEALEDVVDADDGVSKDVLVNAKKILSMMGVDLANSKLVRVVNEGALDRAIKVACRDPKVKRAVSMFMRTVG